MVDDEKNTVVNDIIQSYTELGVVNREGHNGFPSKEVIHSVLDCIKELLFPGFFGSGALEETTLHDVTQERVSKVFSILVTEIERSLVWARRQACATPSEDFFQASELAKQTALDFLRIIPKLRQILKQDAQAVVEGDPAAKNLTEVILCYPGFQAILVYRIAHFFYQRQIPLVPRQMTEIAHSETGIDIHPGASIGHHFCIDHGTGVVIGETAVIGNWVKLYQGVTLGAFSVSKLDSNQRRHPVLEDHVTVYARSTILGGKTVIGAHCVIGGNVWLTESLPAGSKIYLSPEFKSSFKTDSR